MRAVTNGDGRRQSPSWIESFIEHTDNLDSPIIFRKWAAITTIAAALEQKVWLNSGGSLLHPNLYTYLIGHPGTGKTRAIRVAKAYLGTLHEPHIAPTSMTGASLVDALSDAKRFEPSLGEERAAYNSMVILADELGAFQHSYEDDMIAILSAFYDPDPYGQQRRGKEIKIKIKRPQLNMLCGATPSNLIRFIPEGAWDQGFTSRNILVFSDERMMIDDFEVSTRPLDEKLKGDLVTISSIIGEIKATQAFATKVWSWRTAGELPLPTHPKLRHYNTRRRAHLYKLSMISALDRSDVLIMDTIDFDRALMWLLEAEAYMPDIFKAGAVGSEAQAQEEAAYFVGTAGEKGMNEQPLVNFLRQRLPYHAVTRTITLMELSGMIQAIKIDKLTGHRVFVRIKSPES